MKTFRDELIEEFTKMWTESKGLDLSLLVGTEAVVVLCGDKFTDAESQSRFCIGLDIWQKTNGKALFVWSGVTDERDFVTKKMRQAMPVSLFTLGYFQDCGKRGSANTKKQFEVFASDPKTANMKDVVFVTNAYHCPRVKRTAGKILGTDVNFNVVIGKFDYKYYNAFLKVMGEIDRIEKYSASGDILKYPR